MKPPISIVISSYNRADKLNKALRGIQEQQGVAQGQFEVLVVDNNSADDSEKITVSYQSDIDIRFVREKKQGLGHVRNTGFLLANGEYVAYLDDDAIPDPDWINQILDIIASEKPDCICGPIFPYYDSEKPVWFLDKYEIRSKGEDQRLLLSGEEGSGSNMTWRKEVLAKLGGIDVNMGMRGEAIVGGEDSDLFRRYWQYVDKVSQAGRIIYSPKVKVLHWTPEYKMRVNYILKRDYAAGIAAARMRREDKLFQKFAASIKIIAEMAFILLRFPLMRYTYEYKENWVVEEMRRLYLRAGWILTYLGLSEHPSI